MQAIIGIRRMYTRPWQLAPQLQQDYIQQLAHLLVQIRGEVIDRHDPDLGDTRLSLGMRAYECCRSRIIQKDTDGDWPWLSILTKQGRFTFAIDGVPVRFSRNEPDQLPNRKLIPSYEGYEQMAFFGSTNDHAHLRWYLVIDTPYNVPVEHAYFVGYSSMNEIICKWEVPLSDQVPVMSEVDRSKPQADKVPPIKAKLKLTHSQEKEGDDGK